MMFQRLLGWVADKQRRALGTGYVEEAAQERMARIEAIRAEEEAAAQRTGYFLIDLMRGIPPDDRPHTREVRR